MGGAVHAGTTAGPASFELERLEQADGRLVVSGWWEGVRGMRFVRPALVVDGRQVLATLEHKPWAADGDGAWTAAFPWKEDAELDAGRVLLVVAPSVEVPLDRDAAPPSEPVDPGGSEGAVHPDRGALAAGLSGTDRSAGYAARVPSVPESESAVAAPRDSDNAPAVEPIPTASRAEPKPRKGKPAARRADDGEPEGELRVRRLSAGDESRYAAPASRRADEGEPEGAELRVSRMPAAGEDEPGLPGANGAVYDGAAPPADELRELERLLGALRAELDEARATIAEREHRCRELEQEVVRERRTADAADASRKEVERANAIAVRDRDRAVEQLEEAILDREAALRTRMRMEAQRDEAIQQRERAEARRDEARAQRTEARRQRDDALLAHRALHKQLKSGLARADRRGELDEELHATPDEPDEPDDALETLPYADEADEVDEFVGPAWFADDDDAVEPQAAGDDAASRPRPADDDGAGRRVGVEDATARRGPSDDGAAARRVRIDEDAAARRLLSDEDTATRRVRSDEDTATLRVRSDEDTAALRVPSDEDATALRPPSDDDTQPFSVLDDRGRDPAPLDAEGRERPIGVRVIPASRTVAAHMHRAERVREHGVTKWDLWAIRVLGTVAAISFITLLVMILKVFFVF